MKRWSRRIAFAFALVALAGGVGVTTGGVVAGAKTVYVITSIKQIKPSVLAKLRSVGRPGAPGVGVAGPQGVTGLPGAQGPTGATGATGVTGAPGAEGKLGVAQAKGVYVVRWTAQGYAAVLCDKGDVALGGTATFDYDVNPELTEAEKDAILKEHEPINESFITPNEVPLNRPVSPPIGYQASLRHYKDGGQLTVSVTCMKLAA